MSPTAVICRAAGAPPSTANASDVPWIDPVVTCTACEAVASVKRVDSVNTPLLDAGTSTTTVGAPANASPITVAPASWAPRPTVTGPPANGTACPPALRLVTVTSVAVPALTGDATVTRSATATSSATVMLGVGPATVNSPPPIPRNGNR